MLPPADTYKVIYANVAFLLLNNAVIGARELKSASLAQCLRS